MINHGDAGDEGDAGDAREGGARDGGDDRCRHAGSPRPLFGRWMARVAAGALAGVILAAPAAGAAGPTSVVADVQCDPAGDGVLDLTFNNDGDSAATFVVTDARSSATSTVTVAAHSAGAITFSGLPDGLVVVPVQVDGVASQVSGTVKCDAPAVQVLPARPTRPRWASRRVAGSLPATGAAEAGLVIGGILVAAGIAASLIARRRYS